MKLYPLKFKPIFKETVWGGNRLKSLLHKNISGDKKVGESWELSAVRGNLSVVSNGYLKGNNIEELIEVYMGELVGEKVYEQFGNEFPLLIKFLDTTETLSLQVHPDDATAAERHHAFGKNEMWYIVAADADAKIALGFGKDSNLGELLEHVEKNTLHEILNLENVKAGDTFYVPAGTLHAIGKNITLAEIQQTSDITYRVYDWGRNEKNRPLHTDLAMDVIDYRAAKNHKVEVKDKSHLIENKYFTTNLLNLSQAAERNLSEHDSFIIYVCTSGEAKITAGGQAEKIAAGETLLIPAALSDVQVAPQGSVTLLEVYIK
ncbi:MAG: class I mannose-6-phosphate isomerase [Prevotellaceae bacterium]|jgi:mannose-6-phosphate isomerase|nr:class I mannose-6-phosphate isomerase [Prevotellaceae bacterium]